MGIMQKKKGNPKGKRYGVHKGKGALKVCSRGRESG